MRPKIQLKTIINLFHIQTTLLNKCIKNFNFGLIYMYVVSKRIESNIIKYYKIIKIL